MIAPSAKSLTWPGKNISFLPGPRRHGDLLLGGGERLVEADAVDDAAAVGEEGAVHRRVGRAEDLLVELPHVRRVERAGLVIGGHAVGVLVGHHLLRGRR